MGLPFLPVRGIAGSDYFLIRPDFKVIDNPYDPVEKLVTVPAIVPEISLFHAFQADKMGNLLTDPSQEAGLLARATLKSVIVSVEEVVDQLACRPDREFVPAELITGIVKLPKGAHPTSCRGYYPLDHAHVEEYLAAAADPLCWKDYQEKYIYRLSDHSDYLHQIGPDAHEQASGGV